jgi:hypothetical protein
MGDRETELFGRRSRLHETANISFLAEDSAEVTLFADGIEMSGFEPQLPVDTAEDCEVAVKFAFGRFTVPSAVGLFVDDTIVSPRFRVRRPEWELTLEGFKQSARLIMAMEAIEGERRAFEKLSSDFESRVKEGIENLESDQVLKKVARRDEIKRIREVLDEQRLVLENGTVENMAERKQHVDSVLAAVERRAAEFVGRPIAWRRFDEATDVVRTEIANGSTDSKAAEKYKAAMAWSESARAEQARRADAEDPAVFVADIDRMREELLATAAMARRNTGGRHDLVPVPEIEDLPLTDEWEPGI